MSLMSSDDTLRPRTGAGRPTSTSDDLMMENISPPTTEAHSERHRLLKPDRRQHAGNSSRTDLVSADHPKSSKLNAPRLNKLSIWWKESALLLVALGLLIAIVSILVAYGGKPLPKWTLGLNLNTIVALLATSLRSSLVMAVEEG
jgi:hypothetical protein